MSSLQVKYYNTLTNICIVRVSRDDHKLFGTVLNFITTIKNRDVSIKTIHVAGKVL